MSCLRYRSWRCVCDEHSYAQHQQGPAQEKNFVLQHASQIKYYKTNFFHGGTPSQEQSASQLPQSPQSLHSQPLQSQVTASQQSVMIQASKLASRQSGPHGLKSTESPRPTTKPIPAPSNGL